MSHHQIIPETCGLFPAGAEGGPGDGCTWMPRNFYRAIAHVLGIADRHSSVKYSSGGRTDFNSHA